MNKTFPNKSKPFEVTVTDIGVHGDGIANGVGGRYFIPYSAPGYHLAIKPGDGRKAGRFAKIEKIITPSDSRIDPVCPHFGTCGGCALQHLAESIIADAKRGFVATALAQQGLHCDVSDMLNIAAGMRRRVRYSVFKGQKTSIGFLGLRSRRVVNIATCPAIRPSIANLIEPLRDLTTTISAIETSAAVQISESDIGLDLLLESKNGADIGLQDRETLAKFANRYDLARISWRGSLGPEPVSQRRQPVYRFGPATVAPPPNAFLQPSKEGESAIVSAACRALSGAGRIADLYAGCGALTFPFSSIAPTHAFESDAEMVAAIHRAAGDRPVTASVRDLARMPLATSELSEFDAVVFDPPRAGAKTQAAMLAASSVRVVVAISCNPATLARDLRLLVDGGYRLESVLPIDQFPWSPHVEIVATLRRTRV